MFERAQGELEEGSGNSYDRETLPTYMKFSNKQRNGFKRVWWTLTTDRRLGALETESKEGNHLRWQWLWDNLSFPLHLPSPLLGRHHTWQTAAELHSSC